MVLQLVHVVEDEHERLLARRERRAEAGETLAPERVARDRLEDARRHGTVGVERLRHVGQEEHRVVVAPVQREPGERPSVGRRPLAESGGLAVSRRGDDADDAAGSGPREALHQAGSLDEPGPPRRDVQLGPQQLEPGRLAAARALLMRSIVGFLRRRQRNFPPNPADTVGTTPRAPQMLPFGAALGGLTAGPCSGGRATIGRMRGSKRLLVAGGGIVLVAATFFFLLPRIADYRDVWDVVQTLSWEWVAGAARRHRRQHRHVRAALAGRPARAPLLAGADDDAGVDRPLAPRAGRGGRRDRELVRDAAQLGLRLAVGRAIGDARQSLEPVREPDLSHRRAVPADDDGPGDGDPRHGRLRRRRDPRGRGRRARGRPVQQPHGRGHRRRRGARRDVGAGAPEQKSRHGGTGAASSASGSRSSACCAGAGTS